MTDRCEKCGQKVKDTRFVDLDWSQVFDAKDGATVGTEIRKIQSCDVQCDSYGDVLTTEAWVVVHDIRTDTFYKKFGTFDSYSAVPNMDGALKVVTPKTQTITTYEFDQ